MSRFILLLSFVAAAASPALAQPPTRTPVPTPPPAIPTIHHGDRPPIGLEDGYPSIDALVDAFLAAVHDGDVAAMHRMRMTKEEYCAIVVPGEVPRGQPPRTTFREVNDVFFGMMDSRSRYTADAIVAAFAGKTFPSRRVEMTRGTREYAWYTGHGQLRVVFTDAEGREQTLRTGWIAEVDGRFKFIGLNKED